MSESDFHRWLADRQRASRHVPMPAGDDLAGIAVPSGMLLAGSDQVLEGVHFEKWTDPVLVGRKAMNRNLSDVAAMGALPHAAIVTAALPTGYGLENAKQLYLGLEAAAAVFDCPIVGGDTGSWNGPLALSVTILADPAGFTPITRRGARPGDGLFVTGPLGDSLASGRHMTFSPRIREARRLVRTSEIHAMIDLSDGLTRDLPRLCTASGVGADLESDQIPCNATLEAALNDGEDYELLLAAPAIADGCGVARIGTVTAEPVVRIDGQPLPPGGWEHGL
ncbi:MAG: thiamine-phosphate kinase [Planctomycetota bacterium]